MTHGPIQQETVDAMNAIAKAVDIALNGNEKPSTWGFAILVYPFGEVPNGRMNYIGNGRREDMLVALKELVARWEGRHPEESGQPPGRT